MKNLKKIKTQSLRPSPTAILNPRCDPIFKAIFTQGTEKSNFALKDLISSLLGREIAEMELLPNEEPVEILDEKQMSFDVNVTFDDGEKAELEMQGRNQDYDYASRAEIHAAKLLSSGNKRGSSYDSPKVYQISVLNFEMDKDDNSPVSWYTMRKETGARLAGKLNVIFLDLVKVRRLIDKPVEQLTKAEKWGMFFAYADSEKHQPYVRKVIESEEALMAADFIVKTMSKEDAEWFRQNSYENAIWDYNHGMYRAEKRGERRKALETAKNALAMGLIIEQISKLTGLPVEEVQELQKQHIDK